MDIDAYLHAKFRKGLFEIEGSFELEVTENVTRKLNNTNIKVNETIQCSVFFILYLDLF